MTNITNSSSPSHTRYNYGVQTIKHRGHPITTSVGSQADSLVANIEAVTAKKGRVPAGFGARPDLISNIFYDTPGYWWYLMLVNGAEDPFEMMKAGDRILIPKI